jgi:dGTPase
MCKWMASNNVQSKKSFTYNPDFRRGPFQADLGAIVHSYYFRRLSHKTQVHLNPQVDYPRTRLTHSLEVSQIGAQLGRILADLVSPSSTQAYEKAHSRRFAEDFSDLVSAACLAHDLGQPPFGHAGDNILDAQVKAVTNSASHFEGNKQNIRIIRNERLSVSCALADSIVKYKNHVKPQKDGGAYGIDKKFLEEITTITGTGTARHPASYLMEAADDIAYISGDIEDASKLGLIKLVELMPFIEDLPILDHSYQIDSALNWNQIISSSELEPRKIALYLIRAFIFHVREGLEVSIKGRDLDSVVTGLNDFAVAQAPGGSFNLLYWSSANWKIGLQASTLKDFIYYKRILKTPEIKRAEHLAAKILSELWMAFFESFSSSKFDERDLFYILPSTVQQKIRALHGNKQSDVTAVAHLLADFIAGMSDRYAIELWESVHNPKFLSSAA